MKANPKWEMPKYACQKWKEGHRHLFYTGARTRNYVVGVGKTKGEALVNYVIQYHFPGYVSRSKPGNSAHSRQGPCRSLREGGDAAPVTRKPRPCTRPLHGL